MTDRGPGTQSRMERFDAPADAPRLDVLVAQQLDLSRNQAATLIANGHVLVAGRRERASYRAEPGESIAVEVPAPVAREVLGENIPLAVRYEDDDLVVIDKPAGMVVHPAPGNWTGTLVNALKGRGEPLSSGGDPTREGIVHRLDKETSGLLLVAKTDRAHRVLGAAIAARRISRRYAVMCWGHLDEDQVTVDKPLARDPRNRQRMAVVADGKAAKTTFVRIARLDAGDLLRAHLFTGRTHQIRVHLTSIGHPVIGDDTYGGGGGRKLVALPPKRHFLHAAWLIFSHPVSGERIELRSPLPDDLRTALIRSADGAIPPDTADPLETLGFYSVES
ncbi:MAG TPA: RluA family pseudouridine synthase [Gemmatimonadaceae bacterium]|nr:RluA family pseudouridine synthase [Gemmatimonadaceae bacterium]